MFNCGGNAMPSQVFTQDLYVDTDGTGQTAVLASVGKPLVKPRDLEGSQKG